MSKKILIPFLITIFPLLVHASIFKIEVDAPIHPITSEYIRNSIDRAEKENISLLIMTLNTPGGLDSSMREIIERILSSKTPIVAFVSPSGSRSASAGFFIAIACDIFVMAPGTNTGAAHPVGISITGQQMDKTMEDKVTNDAASYIKTLAEQRGRNVKLAAVSKVELGLKAGAGLTYNVSKSIPLGLNLRAFILVLGRSPSYGIPSPNYFGGGIGAGGSNIIWGIDTGLTYSF